MKHLLSCASIAALLALAFAALAPAADEDVVEGVQVGNRAVDFTLTTVKGTKVKLSDLRGKRGVVLDFWATWCPPCRKGIPHLIEFKKKYAEKDLVVLGVNLRESKTKVEKFIEEIGINYPVLLDSTAKVAKAYEVQGIPTYIGIDKNGIIRHRQHGMPENEDAFVEQLTK